ncbi:MAG: TetR/AcrR family transcriptional regulator [Coriobacteriales bacterium]|jgi:AcrR family transcriptional regulator
MATLRPDDGAAQEGVKGAVDIDAQSSRYLATAVRMDEAFLELLGEKDFPYVTVKEICARAGVNRSTFYLHYETIEDLLTETMTHVQQEFMGLFSVDSDKAVQRLSSCPIEELDLVTDEYLRPYLTFVRDRKTLFRVAIDHPGTLRADRTYDRMYHGVFETILRRLGVPEADRGYLMAFYIQGIMAVVTRWIEGGCADPLERVASVIRQCIPSVRAQGR